MKFIFNVVLVCCICTLAFYLQSCYDPNSHTPCGGTQYITQNIPESDLNKVPYTTGFDTLYFLNKNGDTCIVRGTGREFSYDTEEDFDNPACDPTHIYQNQRYSLHFVPIKGNLEFTISQAFGKNLEIVRSVYGIRFFSELALIGVKDDISVRYYIDSITINNRLYDKVSVFLPSVIGQVQTYDTTYKLLYNKPFGILLIKSTKHNEEFSIIPKI